MNNQVRHVTLYGTLGIDRSASELEIKEGYYRKAAENHPDRGGNESVMADINLAAQVLLNPTARAKYDRELTMLAELCPACKGAGRGYKQKGFSARTVFVCRTCNGNGMLRWKSKGPPTTPTIAMAGTVKRKRK